MKKKKRIKNSILLTFFLLFVLIVISIAVIVHIIILISQSTFDYHHQFILEIQLPKQVKIIVFNPDINTINELLVSDPHHSNVISLLDIPIDARIFLQNNDTSLSSLLFSVSLSCNVYQCDGLNPIDALKLYRFARTVQNDKITHESLTIPINSTYADTIIPSLFTDETIYQEALSISIVNASGETGIGNKLAKMLSNIGGNVISVTSTGNTSEITSLISHDIQQKYTIKRLEKILHFQKITMQKPAISDIMIVIGKKHVDF